MIRLIATDVDGTIVGDGSPDLNPEYYDVIRKLTAMGIQIVVATGRHTDSIVRLFEPVKDQLIYICDNGATSGRWGHPFTDVCMPDRIYSNLLKASLELKECEILITTADQGYILSTASEEFENLLIKNYRFDVKRHEHPEVITGVIKVSLYHPSRIREKAGFMIDQWSDSLYGVVSGACWIDFMMPDVGKGNCLAGWLQSLHIRPEECVAFGDQKNDLGMLRLVGKSFAVDTAVEECRAEADEIIPGYKEDGVLDIWKKILRQKGEFE